MTMYKPFHPKSVLPNRAKTCAASVFGALAIFGGLASAGGQYGLFTYSGSSTITITDYPVTATGSAVIPSSIAGVPVTQIGSAAFRGCTGLTSVTIPSSVTSIGDYAFQDCSALSDLTLPSSVGSIGNYAFYRCIGLRDMILPSIKVIGFDTFNGCSGLTRVVIPSTVDSIAFSAFYNCSSMTSFVVDFRNSYYSSLNGVLFNKLQTNLVQYPAGLRGSYTLPASVTGIGGSAFKGCSGLTSFTVEPGNPTYSSSGGVLFNKSLTSIVNYPAGLIGSYTIPSSVTSIGSAFSGCTGLTSVTIPSSVTSISFSGCTGLTSVTIPSSVTSISFSGCTGLTSVTIPSSVTNIGGAFNGCTRLTSVTIPSSVTSIGDSTFKNCSALTSMTIPASVTSIGVQAFAGCSGLKSLTIPPSVTSIGTGAFEDCGGLTNVTIPASVTNIRTAAFENCRRLNSIEVDPGNANYSSMDGVLFDKSATSVLRCPPGLVGNYTIHSTVTSIGNSAFEGCGELTEVTIPSSVTTIGTYAFSRCGKLSHMTIPASVNSISAFMFSDCGGLKDVTIPSSVTTIGEAAFFHCGGLSGVTIPSSVTYIGDSAFYGCRGLAEVTLPSSLSIVRAYAFYACSGLKSVTLSSVSNIMNNAFTGCSGLTGVTIPSSVSNIGFCAFSECGALTFIEVAAANRQYSSLDGVLFNKSLTELIQYPAALAGSYTIPSTALGIGAYAFSDCGGLTSVTIPSSVTGIDNTAFVNCNGLTSITVDAANAKYSSLNGVLFDKTRSILLRAPASLSGTYTIPSSVTDIGDSAFAGCRGLTSVTIPTYLGSIGTYAFAGCSALTSLTIRARVYSIGAGAFLDCRMLTSIAVDAENPTFSSAGGLLFDKFKTTLIQYPTGLMGSFTIPASVTNIKSYALSGCGGLVSIGVEAANINYSSLNGVLFDKSQTTLIQYPAGLNGSYTIPSTVARIGDHALHGCSGLTEIIIPRSVTSIGDAAFSGCDGLTTATFLGAEPTMGFHVFPHANAAFTVYYCDGRLGFSSPLWWTILAKYAPDWFAAHGDSYPAISLGVESPVAEWLISNGLPCDTDLESTPNDDGVSLLMAYALRLDPNRNLSGSMPRPAFTGNKMKISFHGNSVGITYVCETSTDMQVWTSEGVALTEPDSDGLRTATVEKTGTRRFLRLSVNH